MNEERLDDHEDLELLAGLTAYTGREVQVVSLSDPLLTGGSRYAK